MVTRRGFIRTSGIMAAGLALPSISRGQGQTEYKLSVPGSKPLGVTVAAYRWAELVGERTDGRINIKVYPNSQLVGGDQTREVTAVRQGIVDFNVTSTINMSPQIPEMNLFSMPFLMPGFEGFKALIAPGPARDKLDESLTSRDVIPLAWSGGGFRELCNSQRDIHTPDDVKGLKIRYAAGQIYADTFTALGANPLQMAWADLQPALATGVVDGVEVPVNVFIQVNLDKVGMSHVSVWDYAADAYAFQLSRKVWESFEAADQEILRETAEIAAQEHTEISFKGVSGGDMTSYDELKARNVSYVLLSAEEKQAFRDATKDVFEKWKPTVGAELVDSAVAAIAKAG